MNNDYAAGLYGSDDYSQVKSRPNELPIAAADPGSDEHANRPVLVVRAQISDSKTLIPALRRMFEGGDGSEGYKISGSNLEVKTRVPKAAKLVIMKNDPLAKVTMPSGYASDPPEVAAAASEDGDEPSTTGGGNETNLRYVFPSEQAASKFVDGVFRMKKGIKSAYKGRAAVVLRPGMYAADISSAARALGGKPAVAASGTPISAASTKNWQIGDKLKVLKVIPENKNWRPEQRESWEEDKRAIGKVGEVISVSSWGGNPTLRMPDGSEFFVDKDDQVRLVAESTLPKALPKTKTQKFKNGQKVKLKPFEGNPEEVGQILEYDFDSGLYTVRVSKKTRVSGDDGLREVPINQIVAMSGNVAAAAPSATADPVVKATMEIGQSQETVNKASQIAKQHGIQFKAQNMGDGYTVSISGPKSKMLAFEKAVAPVAGAKSINWPRNPYAKRPNSFN